MKLRLFSFVAFSIMLLFGSVSSTGCQTKTKNPQVLFSTSLGDITIELFADKAPLTVKNFLAYVDSGFYNGTIIHRVIPGFVIQGGGFASGMVKKETFPPIKNEADNGVKNSRGTLSMARTNDINSATSQFFVNLKDNAMLDNTPNNFGYAVFGKVTAGMEVVDKIAQVPTGNRQIYQNVPLTDVVVKSAKRK